MKQNKPKKDPAAPRADAALNRERILDAAQAVFAEHDAHASLELIVQQSGVSRTTLFRHYPDRRALLTALLNRLFDELEALTCARPMGDDGLFVVLRVFAERVSMGASIVEYWRAADQADAEVQTGLRRMDAIFTPLIEQAKAARLARADLSLADIGMFASMLAGALRARPSALREQVVERGFALLTEGMRT